MNGYAFWMNEELGLVNNGVESSVLGMLVVRDASLVSLRGMKQVGWLPQSIAPVSHRCLQRAVLGRPVMEDFVL